MKSKTLFSTSILLVLGVLSFFSFFTTSFASEETSVPSDEIVLGNTVRNNLDTYVNTDNFVQVHITDEANLKANLEKLKATVTIDQIKDYIQIFNNQIVKENGTGQLTNTLKKLSPDPTYRFDTCSAVFGVAGLAHSTLYGAAAGALSVAWPVGVGVGAAVGAAYLAGSMLC